MNITTLNKKAIAVTGLPEVATLLSVNGIGNCLSYSLNGIPQFIDLPEGNWSILGRAAELTEDDWKRVVEKVNEFDINGLAYTDYLSTSIWDTATESGHSLLKSKGLYGSNPYTKPLEDEYMPGENFTKKQQYEYWKAQREWQSAELLTNPLILIQ